MSAFSFSSLDLSDISLEGVKVCFCNEEILDFWTEAAFEFRTGEEIDALDDMSAFSFSSLDLSDISLETYFFSSGVSSGMFEFSSNMSFSSLATSISSKITLSSSGISISLLCIPSVSISSIDLVKVVSPPDERTSLKLSCERYVK